MSENVLYPNVDPKKINIAPGGFTLNNLGVIELDASYDVSTLKHGGRYFCRSLGEGAPISGAGACIDVYPSTVNDRVIVIHYRHNATSWQRAMYNGVWGVWKLIAGEVLLWSGALNTANTNVTLTSPLRSFGQIVAEAIGDHIMSTAVTETSKYFMFTGSFIQEKSVQYELSAFMAIEGINIVKNVCVPQAKIFGVNNAITTIPLTITRLVGKP